MAKVKLTAGRIVKFQCEDGKQQSFLWCDEVPGLGVRAISGNGTHKRYIFQAKVNGKSMRVTIGKVGVWSIGKAQDEARRLQVLIDQGNDPRQVKAEKAEAKESNAAAQKAKQVRESATLGMVWPEYVAARTVMVN